MGLGLSSPSLNITDKLQSVPNDAMGVAGNGHPFCVAAKLRVQRESRTANVRFPPKADVGVVSAFDPVRT
jgi:hypothetical protein